MPHVLRSSIQLDRSLDEVFAFFSDAANLEAITPPELKFRILTPLPIEMRPGARIDYRMSLYGVPFSWQTEIPVWEPGKRFVDRQISGPYRLWEHEHRFEALGPRRTAIEDVVHYALPLEPLSRIVLPLVRRKLDQIFRYREQRVAELLGESDSRDG
ncbi:MAG TPA: SRPBCC family protein [Myxococcota bacterium]|nr:SRPBCC family protein [Myxococcota bacterium]